jgi:DNA-directed RNA polymerase subunit beta'
VDYWPTFWPSRSDGVQEYIVNEVQDVYRLQGVKINDKHFESLSPDDAQGRNCRRRDTRFLEQQVVDKNEFAERKRPHWGKKVSGRCR